MTLNYLKSFAPRLKINPVFTCLINLPCQSQRSTHIHINTLHYRGRLAPQLCSQLYLSALSP